MLAALVLAALAHAVAPVDAALLAALPAHEATLNAHGVETKCSGPLLADVAAALGMPMGKALHGAELKRGLIVRAKDGYAVLFSLGELDPGTGGSGAIVATACDGKPLGEETGPFRVVVPGDKRPARSVRNVVSIEPVDVR